MERRKIVWLIVGGVAFLTAGLVFLIAIPSGLLFFLRRRLPRSVAEPGSVFRIGRLSDFGLGVDTQFQEAHRICVVRNADRLYVLYARCTHLGCTPDWSPGENKFRCPCHSSEFCFGSAFDGNGLNCEGPAPRPLDRAHVEVDSEGRLVVDIGKLYQWRKGERSQFDNPGAYVSLTQR